MNPLALLLGLGFGLAASMQDAKEKAIDATLLNAFVGAGAMVFLIYHGLQFFAIAFIPIVVAAALWWLKVFGSGDVYAVAGYSLFYPFYFGSPVFPIPLMTVAIALGFVFLAITAFTAKKEKPFGQYPFLPYLLAGVIVTLATRGLLAT